MRVFLKIIFGLLGLFLPLHGGITVFLPEEFRWWKEVIIVLLLIILFWYELKNTPPLKQCSNQGLFQIRNVFKKSADFFLNLREEKKDPSLWALGILVWGGLLFFVSPDKDTAIIALRYLLLFFAVFVILFRLSHHISFQAKGGGLSGSNSPSIFDHFIHHFILGCVISIAFGTWVKYGNGIDFVQNFYSTTISSWVPGQTIPMWHEVGGEIRMQGLSSGPIEFSHLLLAGLAMTSLLWFRQSLRMLIGAVLLCGIWESASRAACFGSLVLLICYMTSPFSYIGNRFIKKTWNSVLRKTKQKNPRLFLIGMLGIMIIGISALMIHNYITHQIDTRHGTNQHIERPIRAIKIGAQSPWIGNLGQLGPAARAKNLREHNSDQAPIAENLFADIFAQMGVVGLLLVLIFWVTLYLQVPRFFRGFFWATFFVVNFANIFDMTPIAISFGVLFAFLSSFGKKHRT